MGAWKLDLQVLAALQAFELLVETHVCACCSAAVACGHKFVAVSLVPGREVHIKLDVVGEAGSNVVQLSMQSRPSSAPFR